MLNLRLAGDRIPDEKGVARIEGFSDSVFGFAITLLVMDILQIPRPEMGEGITQSFLRHWPSLVSFLVGFCTILVCWINHHHMFTYVRCHDNKLMWINGSLMMIVTFTPLPTAILAEFIAQENSSGIILFGFTYLLIANHYHLIWRYLTRHEMVDPAGDQEFYAGIRTTYLLASIWTAIALVVCFLSTWAAIAMYVVMFAVFAFPHAFATLMKPRTPRNGP